MIKPNVDHAAIIEGLSNPHFGQLGVQAANLIEWQAGELRHLARCVSDRDHKIKELQKAASAETLARLAKEKP